jgi:predicted esterase
MTVAERRAKEKPKGAAVYFGDEVVATPTPVAPESPKLEKVTIYLRAGQADQVADIKDAERRRKRRVSLSELYTEAVDLLVEKYEKGKTVKP